MDLPQLFPTLQFAKCKLKKTFFFHQFHLKIYLNFQTVDLSNAKLSAGLSKSGLIIVVSLQPNVISAKSRRQCQRTWSKCFGADFLDAYGMLPSAEPHQPVSCSTVY